MNKRALVALACMLALPRDASAKKERFSVRAPAPPPAPPTAPRAERVLLISIDGLSWRTYQRQRWQMPNLRALVRKGSARPLRVTFPSMTWTAHASLLTGQYPRHHGVLANRWYERGNELARPYLEADVDGARRKRTPALTDLVAAAGGKVAALNWPMTQGATDIAYNLPEFMFTDSLPFSSASPQVRQLLQLRYRREARPRSRPSGYLAQLTGSIMRREGLETDLLVRDLVRDLVTPPRWLKRAAALQAPPKLMLVHFLLLDTWLHRYGNAPFVERWAAAEVDRMLGAVLATYRRAKILSRTAIFVVSDHGFAEITHTFDLRRVLRERGIAPRTRRGPLSQRSSVTVYNGHAAFLYLRDKSSHGRVVNILRERKYAGCIERVYQPQDYARLGLPSPSSAGAPARHPGIPDLIAMTQPACVFGASRNGRVVVPLGVSRFGHHGYLPSHPQLRGVLVAAGAGLRRLRPRARAAAEIVDVAPTIAQLLALRWPARFPGTGAPRFTLDGRALGALLTDGEGMAERQGAAADRR